MATHGVGEPSLPESGNSHSHHHIPFAVPHHMLNTPYINQEGPAFGFGELEEAIVLQGLKINNDHHHKKQPLYTAIRPAATLDMFPSWPIKFQHNTPRSSKSREESTTDSVNTISTNRFDHQPESPISTTKDQSFPAAEIKNHRLPPAQMETAGVSRASQQPPAKQNPEVKRRGPGCNSDKVLDAKTLRRLAQNREAARKSRLRKKAYVQQLESSRVRLSQLEQDLQRARSQGLFLGSGGVASSSISSGGAIFDMDYARWLDEDHRHLSELRNALQAHLPDGDMRLIVENYIAHYDEIFRLKGVAAKSDVFHLITGMWATPAERCFLWMAGFRPSDLIKMLIAQLDPLTEQQVMGIYGLQQSTQQAEEALSQGLEQLQQSLIDTIANGSINDNMHHMAIALGKLANLEGFVRQADNLRQQTLHQLHRILTVRQSARCFLVIGEYYGRLRALSSLWASRPRETLIVDDNSCQTTMDLQMVQSSQNQFANF
ncbi:BZIP family transcription factor family protein [Striga asiatica]|uniref:BZIP family transcription factor family protein n=1 Tax=Striga asiatica TaxID=4170 RepID=A0A5A7PVG5_STRAF|nr:BZIP family transcription factor family protein [Striga asiatica]